jgi:hypothetical protein
VQLRDEAAEAVVDSLADVSMPKVAGNYKVRGGELVFGPAVVAGCSGRGCPGCVAGTPERSFEVGAADSSGTGHVVGAANIEGTRYQSVPQIGAASRGELSTYTSMAVEERVVPWERSSTMPVLNSVVVWGPAWEVAALWNE